ncbi:MAG: GGDEF domain-containing protein [Negativicutes bacterium]|nr:GGDEF domain-containing protein [Negativicutes bacterium]
MNLGVNIVLNAYSIVLLFIIYILSIKNAEKESLQNKIYNLLVKAAILLLVVDLMGRFDGRPDTIYPLLNQVGNYLVFLFNWSIPSLWLLYVYQQIVGDELKTKRLARWLAAVNVGYGVIVTLSLKYGWFYTIDAANIYHRTVYYPLIFVGTFAMMIAAYVLILKNRSKMEARQFFALVFFAFPPGIAVILQIFIYGVAFSLNSLAVSLLIIYLNIQNQIIHTDYLTGVSNRRKLDLYLTDKINGRGSGQFFAAMMLDLNDFKIINDQFGHEAGDHALKTAAGLVSSVLRLADFVARFGGDEFFIILEQADQTALQSMEEKIHQAFAQYNKTSQQPYALSVSIGSALYDDQCAMNAEEFLKKLDRLMYENKQQYKSQFSPEK